MNILVSILIINFSLSIGINAQNFRSRAGYWPDSELDYSDDYSAINERSVPDRYEQQIDRLQDQIYLRDRYIARLEHKINKLSNHLRKQEDIPEYKHRKGLGIANYASSNSKQTAFPHDSGNRMTNEQMMDTIIPQVSMRMPEANCMKSCNHLKKTKVAKDALSQYMYLMVCAEGCRKSIPCLNENYCMPVMQENPDFFIQCVSKCELFKIAPKVFKSGKC